ncbi:Crp/Fnr family transcriptional regulator [Sphingomonas sp. SUN039]|uniref:Crp/Fnr family transcriptional regulator n=1 Tax=Sphingomonas sp. SUN039 TaxID=2937787 RepID=UPI0021641571|nr:Crp/Fnr family transcriptional regulator [Sphingomonas sp. SUN039]UVO54723.1 Crp/Fnr family transcriptional regulator [Sphingomonas sp. SUN039]
MVGTMPLDAPGVIAAAFGCEAAVASIVATKAAYRHYPARSMIAGSEALPQQLYIVIAGRARMLAYAIDGRLVVVEDFKAGALFGEGALFDSAAASHEVTAVDPVDAGAFERHVFLTLMSGYSCIALAVSRLLVARLEATTRRLVEGATLSAAGRIHAELLRQARSSPDMTIRPAPVLATLALSVQSTRESVSRAINALQKRGIIRRDEVALTVVAPHRLEELIY